SISHLGRSARRFPPIPLNAAGSQPANREAVAPPGGQPCGVLLMKTPTYITREHVVRDAHARGWSLLQLAGKVPVEQGWTGRPRETLEDALAWARAGNIGVRTGAVSGIVVIDVDTTKGGMLEGLPPLPITVTVLTGGGGLHNYFALPPGTVIRNSAGKLSPH